MARRRAFQALTTVSSRGKRPLQEDHVLALEEHGVLIVADGFGGPGAGDAASKEACEAVRDFLVREAGDSEATLPYVLRSYYSLAGNVLFNSLIYANGRLLRMNNGRNVHEKGGASVLAAYLDGDLLALGNVGVCNAWLFREGQARELLIPRSFGRMLDPFATEIREDLRAPLTALGIWEDLEPEILEYRVKPGDWLLMHSDGLDAAAVDRVLEIHQAGKPANEAIHEVKAQLERLDCEDNLTSTLVVL